MDGRLVGGDESDDFACVVEAAVVFGCASGVGGEEAACRLEAVALVEGGFMADHDHSSSWGQE